MDGELKQFLMEMESRTNERLASFGKQINEHRNESLAAMEMRVNKQTNHTVERTETKLLTAFYQGARSMEIPVRHNSSSAAAYDERLALVEERISELERR